MFGKIAVGKALAGLAVAGVLSGALATGVLAAPAAGASATPAKQHQHAPRHAAGKVESVTGNVITIRLRDGKDVKVAVSARTKFFEIRGKGGVRKPATLKDIHAGQRLSAAGSWDKNGNFDAALVLFRESTAR
jgi:hypothetical protein